MRSRDPFFGAVVNLDCCVNDFFVNAHSLAQLLGGEVTVICHNTERTGKCLFPHTPHVQIGKACHVFS